MKTLKRFFMVALSVLASTMLMLCVTACNIATPPVNNSNGEENEIRKIYATYVAYAEERGETPLSYEEWLASIKGEKGDFSLSPYGIWLEQGHEGTVEDFFSWLKWGGEHFYGDWAVFGSVDAYCEQLVFYRVCSVCNKLEFKQGTAIDHNWQVETQEPTCLQKGYYFKTCLTCGKEETETFSDEVDHVFEMTYSYNDIYHWFDCVNCSATKDKFEHTEGEDGNCTVCGMEVVDTEGILYDLSVDGTYAVVVGYEGTATAIKIAETYNGVPVTQICDSAFADKSITSIIIPDSVTSIGNSAFEYCSSLTSVVIPDSVTSIGYEAFSSCDSLTSVVIGNGVTTIGSSAFSFCSNLTSVVLGKSVITISDGAFYMCYDLTSVVIPDSVTTIGDWAFAYNYGLTSIVIPDRVTSIGGYAFADCRSLTSVVIPDRVTSIGDGAFSCCFSLTSVVIPDSVTSIGDWAFARCSSLTSLVIPDSVTSIGLGAFYYCSSLTSIEVDINNMAYASMDGNLYNKDCTTLIQYAIGKEDSEFVVPDSVTSICDCAFEYCDSLTSVVIGDGVTSIGNSAFNYCSSFTSVYYKGTAAGWININIDYNNYDLINATKYYYSESEPATTGNYWHYDENGNPVVW